MREDDVTSKGKQKKKGAKNERMSLLRVKSPEKNKIPKKQSDRFRH